MKLSPAEQEALIALLTRLYGEIRNMEEMFNLLAGGEDFRPRIEHFHDAVRAFSAGRTPERLAVGALAYDLACLRYIASAPLAPFKPQGESLSPATDMVALDKGLTVRPPRPDRAARERLAELYRHYAIVFASLLKPHADADYHERIDALNQDVEDMHALAAQMEALAENKDRLKEAMAAIHHVEDDGLRTELLRFMQQQKFKKKEHMQKLVQFLRELKIKKDKEIAAVETAHLNYVTAQLGIFEGAKDTLKTLAAQGLNLVGKFVENAIAESRREMGR